MGPTRKEDEDLAEAIVGGEMRNAWEKETRPGNRDMRPIGIGRNTRDEKAKYNYRSKAYRSNYDGIFRKGVGDGKEESGGSSGEGEGGRSARTCSNPFCASTGGAACV